MSHVRSTICPLYVSFDKDGTLVYTFPICKQVAAKMENKVKARRTYVPLPNTPLNSVFLFNTKLMVNTFLLGI